jgi:hypothetical protein
MLYPCIVLVYSITTVNSILIRLGVFVFAVLTSRQYSIPVFRAIDRESHSIMSFAPPTYRSMVSDDVNTLL